MAVRTCGIIRAEDGIEPTVCIYEIHVVDPVFGHKLEVIDDGRLIGKKEPHSGMLPAVGHEPKFVGRLGKELDANAGREAVRIAALNVLSEARQKLGSLDKVTRVVRLCIYLATDGDFFDQPKVADAASELLRDIFGEDKTSVRMV